MPAESTPAELTVNPLRTAEPPSAAAPLGPLSEPKVERKEACPECGADLIWMPQHQTLGCAYCGTILPRSVVDARARGVDEPPKDAAEAAVDPDGSGALLPRQSARVVELDLLEALRNPAAHRDWGSARREVQCQSCKAVSIFVDGRVAQACEFCGSPSILTHESHGDAITPQSVLPFKLERTVVQDRVRAWYGSLWFAPNQLKTAASTDRLHGIYLPYWTFDARVAARWTAEAGFTTIEHRPVRGPDGKMVTEQVRHVRWEPAAGSFEHFFDDELVAGTAGIHPGLLRGIEPFPTTTDLQPYTPDFVRGWTVERYQIDLRDAQAQNLEAMRASVRAMASSQVPGDTQRNLQVAADFTGRTFKHVLVPVWLVSYRFQGKPYQVVVNGWTGTIAGERPWSWVKIAVAVILALIVFAIIAASQQT